MTTTELIEKYGIGHNCLSDAYALGMAHGLDGMENACRLAEEKARVDAIEECMEILKDTSRRNCSYLLDEIAYRAVEQMENLKEQKNE